MEILIILSIIILAVVGLLGGVLPVLPGPPISFAALLLMWIVGGYDVSTTQLWVTGILMLLLTVLDYVAPIILTKIGGGTKAGEKGATVGLFLGLFFMPWGLIVAPFLGALIGELFHSPDFSKALRVASLSFIAFLLTTGLKLIYSIVIIIMLIMQFF